MTAKINKIEQNTRSAYKFQQKSIESLAEDFCTFPLLLHSVFQGINWWQLAAVCINVVAGSKWSQQLPITMLPIHRSGSLDTLSQPRPPSQLPWAHSQPSRRLRILVLGGNLRRLNHAMLPASWGWRSQRKALYIATGDADLRQGKPFNIHSSLIVLNCILASYSLFYRDLIHPTFDQRSLKLSVLRP